MSNKTKHKTRMTKKKKQNTQVMQQTKTRRWKKVIRLLRVLFLPHLGRTFPLIKPLNRWRGGKIKTVQVRKEHEGLEKITKRSERKLKLILASRRYHAIALLSG